MTEQCIDISLETVRAYIQIGAYYFVTKGMDSGADGDILSFTISQSRTQPVGSFRCQLQAKIASISLGAIDNATNNIGPKIVVYAGVGTTCDTNLPRLFTGFITNISEDPHWEDSRYMLWNITGEDVFVQMKYQKFSRRFRNVENAFAVITEGKHREGGKMTELKRVAAGQTGVSHHDSGSATPNAGAGGGHSPLIKTPDPVGLTPHGSRLLSNPATDPKAGVNLKFDPEYVYANAGDKIFARIIDTAAGTAIDPSQLAQVTGAGCLLCMTPPPSAFTGATVVGASLPQGMKPGVKAFPISVELYGAANPYPSDANAMGCLFTVIGDYPAKVTFIHPLTAATCSIQFYQIPVHDHSDLSRGGPAVASFGSLSSS